VKSLVPKLFGTNGIRGVVNKEFTPTFIAGIGSAIGTYFGGGRVLVARDGRVSGTIVKNALLSGLLATGCNVVDLGMIPTPTAQYVTRFHEARGCIVITASHNPPEFNGIKVCGSDGVEISREDEVVIEKNYFESRYTAASWNALGHIVEDYKALELYREAVKSHVNVNTVRKAGLKVVFDAGNGVGSLVTPQLLRELGCEILTINGQVDGMFPGRLPEPRPEYLTALPQMVRALEADLGVAHDGDADRAIFVDEEGVIHPGDRSFALIEKAVLEAQLGETIVTSLSSSQAVKDIADKYGGKLVWTRVGSVVVARTMKSLNAILGGEENGGIFYGPHQSVRDAAMTTALILKIMAEAEKPLSAMMSQLPHYELRKERVSCPNELKDRVMKELVGRAQGTKVETLDGVKIWFPDDSWVLIRPSGTEPIYRVIAEARTVDKAASLAEEHKSIVERLVEELGKQSPP